MRNEVFEKFKFRIFQIVTKKNEIDSKSNFDQQLINLIDGYVGYMLTQDLSDSERFDNFQKIILEAEKIKSDEKDYLKLIMDAYNNNFRIFKIENQATGLQNNYDNYYGKEYSWRSRKGRQKNRQIIDQKIANYTPEQRFNHNCLMYVISFMILLIFLIFIVAKGILNENG